jgi:hypothetical protein
LELRAIAIRKSRARNLQSNAAAEDIEFASFLRMQASLPVSDDLSLRGQA